jgi:hypothetical protein
MSLGVWNLGACWCGEPIMSMTIDTSRGILDVRAGVTSAPVTRECRAGHSITDWEQTADNPIGAPA